MVSFKNTQHDWRETVTDVKIVTSKINKHYNAMDVVVAFIETMCTQMDAIQC